MADNSLDIAIKATGGDQSAAEMRKVSAAAQGTAAAVNTVTTAAGGGSIRGNFASGIFGGLLGKLVVPELKGVEIGLRNISASGGMTAANMAKIGSVTVGAAFALAGLAGKAQQAWFQLSDGALKAGQAIDRANIGASADQIIARLDVMKQNMVAFRAEADRLTDISSMEGLSNRIGLAISGLLGRGGMDEVNAQRAGIEAIQKKQIADSEKASLKDLEKQLEIAEARAAGDTDRANALDRERSLAQDILRLNQQMTGVEAQRAGKIKGRLADLAAERDEAEKRKKLDKEMADAARDKIADFNKNQDAKKAQINEPLEAKAARQQAARDDKQRERILEQRAVNKAQADFEREVKNTPLAEKGRLKFNEKDFRKKFRAGREADGGKLGDEQAREVAGGIDMAGRAEEKDDFWKKTGKWKSRTKPAAPAAPVRAEKRAPDYWISTALEGAEKTPEQRGTDMAAAFEGAKGRAVNPFDPGGLLPQGPAIGPGEAAAGMVPGAGDVMAPATNAAQQLTDATSAGAQQIANSLTAVDAALSVLPGHFARLAARVTAVEASMRALASEGG